MAVPHLPDAALTDLEAVMDAAWPAPDREVSEAGFFAPPTV